MNNSQKPISVDCAFSVTTAKIQLNRLLCASLNVLKMKKNPTYNLGSQLMFLYFQGATSVAKASFLSVVMDFFGWQSIVYSLYCPSLQKIDWTIKIGDWIKRFLPFLPSHNSERKKLAQMRIFLNTNVTVLSATSGGNLALWFFFSASALEIVNSSFSKSLIHFFCE